MKKKSDFLVVIPAYNEEETIEEVVLRARDYADVCVINDNSEDATAEILSRIDGIHVIHHKLRTHIPGGILDGMEYATEQGYDYAITMDAGLSHNPDEIPIFINHPYADLTIGVRTNKTNTPLKRMILSKTGNFIYNASLDFPSSLFQKRYFRDITSGFRRYSNHAMRFLVSKRMKSKSFDILLETTTLLYRHDLLIDEVPITYHFSNTSLNFNVIRDCVVTSLRLTFSFRRSSRI